MVEKQNRIKEALEIRKLRAIDLVEKSGISKSSLSSYMSQRWQPKQKALYKMAIALNVSELWLAGYDVPMERREDQKKMDELVKFLHKLRKDENLKNVCISISTLNDKQFLEIKDIINRLQEVKTQ